MTPDSSHTAHKLLEYAITRVAVTGKEKKVQTTIPYETLMADIGKSGIESDYDLQITIDLKWTPKPHLTTDDDISEGDMYE